ncbi:MAG: hypothetical protein WA152_03350 [Microgenomates group bacterium]
MHKYKFDRIILILLSLSLIAIYHLTSAGATSFDYFTRLADSFIKGIYWLTEQPSWLTELIPVATNKFYVVYPPMPAIISMFPRYVFGSLFEQQYLAHILGAGFALTMAAICMKITNSFVKSIWIFLLTGLGTIVWFLSAVGSSWYLGQISAVFFMSLAIYEGLNKKRAYLVGIMIGAAFLSRIETIICVILFLYLYSGRDWFWSYFKLAIGIAPFMMFNFIYNYIRFGTIFDQAYFLLPAILNETDKPWFVYGVANPVYILDNIKVMFWSFPKRIIEFPYIIPSWAGLSIWITTPAFIYALFASLKDKIVRFSWVVIILISLIIFSHGGTGWAQFGYRFAVDFYPFLILLVIKGIEKRKLSWHHWTLLSLSILVNLWGVLWINKFGWVTF